MPQMTVGDALLVAQWIEADVDNIAMRRDVDAAELGNLAHALRSAATAGGTQSLPEGDALAADTTQVDGLIRHVYAFKRPRLGVSEDELARLDRLFKLNLVYDAEALQRSAKKFGETAPVLPKPGLAIKSEPDIDFYRNLIPGQVEKRFRKYLSEYGSDQRKGDINDFKLFLQIEQARIDNPLNSAAIRVIDQVDVQDFKSREGRSGRLLTIVEEIQLPNGKKVAVVCTIDTKEYRETTWRAAADIAAALGSPELKAKLHRGRLPSDPMRVDSSTLKEVFGVIRGLTSDANPFSYSQIALIDGILISRTEPQESYKSFTVPGNTMNGVLEILNRPLGGDPAYEIAKALVESGAFPWATDVKEVQQILLNGESPQFTDLMTRIPESHQPRVQEVLHDARETEGILSRIRRAIFDPPKVPKPGK